MLQPRVCQAHSDRDSKNLVHKADWLVSKERIELASAKVLACFDLRELTLTLTRQPRK